jgi:hypothetical protein
VTIDHFTTNCLNDNFNSKQTIITMKMNTMKMTAKTKFGIQSI